MPRPRPLMIPTTTGFFSAFMLFNLVKRVTPCSISFGYLAGPWWDSEIENLPYNSCRTCLTNHIEFISCHITSLVINSLGCRHTQMHAYWRSAHTVSILRNQACAGLWLACAWFKMMPIEIILQLKVWVWRIIYEVQGGISRWYSQGWLTTAQRY